MESITGYNIIEAESLDAAEKLAQSNPFIASIRVYEMRVSQKFLLSAMGLENLLFGVRPIVLSLARSTTSSSTTLVSNSGKVQRALEASLHSYV